MKLTARLCAIVLSLLALWPLPAQEFTLDWFSIDGGGGASSGGDYSVTGAIGQWDATDMQGGDFAISGGFWSIVTVVETSNAPALSVTLDQGSVVISWPENGSANFSLEATSALGNPNSWSTVNAASESSNGMKSMRLPLVSGKRFYRLHKP